MSFQLFDRRLEPHVRKSLQYLKEAHLACVEHQTAAEHHAALAKMYAERIARIEAEMNSAIPPSFVATHQQLEAPSSEGEIARIESVVAHPSWAGR